MTRFAKLTAILLALTLFGSWRRQAAALETPMQVTGENLAPNPGFEILNPAGNNFPVGWSAIVPSGVEPDASVNITKEAHSGSLAVEMRSTSAAVCGLNSVIVPVARGKLTFWFHAISSSAAGQNLVFYVIGVNSAGIEAAPRVAFVVPSADVGGGKWHQGSLQFDYRDQPQIVGIILAPRINENSPTGAGDWILDDVDVRDGWRPATLHISAFWAASTLQPVNKAVTVGVQITNVGDVASEASEVRLSLPAGVELEPGFETEDHCKPLASQQSWRGEWRLKAVRPMEATLRVTAVQGDHAEEAECRILFVSHHNRRFLCTGADGSWEHYPPLQTLQRGDEEPLRPLRYANSDALPDSPFGIAVQLPRAQNLETIFEPCFLNDGNPHTYWAGWPHATAMPGPPDWVEVRLPHKVKVDAVRLTPYWHGQGFPVDFQIETAAGRRPWRTVVSEYAYRLASGKEEQPVTFAFPAVEANRVRLTVSRFSQVPGFYTDFSSPYECRLAEIEVLDLHGRNVALTSEGGSVACSSTYHSYFSERDRIGKAFPDIFKLGIKWIRVGHRGDPTCWSAVERVKGHYSVDPRTDAAITECAKRGVHILYTLDYGNPLYQRTPTLGDPGPLWHQGHPFYGEAGPTTPAAQRGFVNYCGWVAKHFKGRVSAYEIWNEENSWAWFGEPPDPAAFGRLVKDAARRIKEVDPHAMVVFGGTAALAPTFLKAALKEGAGPYLNAIAFHPYGLPKPEGAVGALDVVDGKQEGIPPEKLDFHDYADVLAGLRRWIEPYCPKAQLWADEWNVLVRRQGMAYPGVSELTQAKTLARFYVTNLFYGVHAFWWSLFNDNGALEWGLLRSADMSRMPSFYTCRAICTTLSGAAPDRGVKAELDTTAPDKTIWTFRGRRGSLLIAAYSALDTSQMKDDAPGTPGTLVIQGVHPHLIEAIDPLYGVTQRLHFTDTTNGVEVPDLLIRDYPMILRIR